MLYDKSIVELGAVLQAKEVSSVELTQAFVDRIEKYKELNAFITVDPDRALAQARAADERIALGEYGPLMGIPIAHKDIFCTDGMRTTCASRILENFVAPYDATVIRQFNQAGAVILGKTNMDEFAMGSSNENSYFGAVRNPWDTGAVPGGSSGGSAAAVAAGLAPAATGTDTGGSIRQPAAYCGITGLKPSYGRVSRYGMVAFASSLDQGGALARSVADAARLLSVMAGFDPRDSTSVDRPVPHYTEHLNDDVKGIKIGIPRQFFGEGLSSEVSQAVEAAIGEFKGLGANVVDVDMPACNLAVSCYYVLAPAEASSNLARYDGVRYGYRASEFTDVMDMYKKTRSEGFGAEVKRRILIGTYVLSAGYYDAYYLKALKLRRLIAEDFRRAFENCDVIVGPTTPTTAFEIGAKVDDPVAMYLNDIYTIPGNMAGLPGLSIPVGFDRQGHPIGFQLMAQYFDEVRLLNVGHQYQRVTDWHKRRPERFE